MIEHEIFFFGVANWNFLLWRNSAKMQLTGTCDRKIWQRVGVIRMSDDGILFLSVG